MSAREETESFYNLCSACNRSLVPGRWLVADLLAREGASGAESRDAPIQKPDESGWNSRSQTVAWNHLEGSFKHVDQVGPISRVSYLVGLDWG